MTNLNDKTVAELKSIAKEMCLVGYSKPKKALLIAMIEANIFYQQEKKTATKINFNHDIYFDNNSICKFKNTNLPLTGKYENEYDVINYFKNGKFHNENGPAHIGKGGDKIYCINNKRYRIDGPAVIYSGGYHEWYINSHYIDKKTIGNWLIENDIPLDWNIWTDSDKMMFALHWSDYNG